MSAWSFEGPGGSFHSSCEFQDVMIWSYQKISFRTILAYSISGTRYFLFHFLLPWYSLCSGGQDYYIDIPFTLLYALRLCVKSYISQQCQHFWFLFQHNLRCDKWMLFLLHCWWDALHSLLIPTLGLRVQNAWIMMWFWKGSSPSFPLWDSSASILQSCQRSLFM